MVYDDRHRTFLQSIMQGGSVKHENAATLCYKIFNENVNVSTVVELINEKLAPIAMVMKSGICELTGEKYWSVVGTTHEEELMLPSEFTNAQRAFLRVIYSEIVSAEDGRISSTDCLNLVSTLDVSKFSMGDGDKFIKNICRHKWLHQKDGFIYIGVRSIVELMPYFRATFVDNFHNCFLCHEVVFSAQKCAYCDEMFHNYCLAKYKTIQKENKCPKCNRSWDSVGDDIPEVCQSQRMQTEKDGARRKENEQQERGSEEDEPMDLLDEIEMSQPMNASRKTKKRKRDHK